MGAALQECSLKAHPLFSAPGPGSHRERPLSATRKLVCKAEDREEDASAVLRAIQVENEALQRAILSRKAERPASPPQVRSQAEGKDGEGLGLLRDQAVSERCWPRAHGEERERWRHP